MWFEIEAKAEPRHFLNASRLVFVSKPLTRL